jgi:hypothetical protein
MRQILTSLAIAGLLCAGAGVDARAADCTAGDIAKAVDATGASLRAFNSDMMTALNPKLKRLQVRRGWSDEDLASHTQALLSDEQVTTYDSQAYEQFNKIDELGSSGPAGSECQRLADIEAAGKTLLATMQAKADHLSERVDLAMKGDDSQQLAAAEPPKSAVTPAPKPKAKPKTETDWTTATAPDPDYAAQQQAKLDALKLPVAPAPSGDPTFTIDEIKQTSSGFFGTITSNLASVIAFAFEKAGRPNGYILGQEAGGAFLAGVRYGDGKLFMKDGSVTPVFWRGPSIGADLGASQSRTMFLVYHLKSKDDVFKLVSGIDGSAFVVGGVGITFLSDGKTILAPIRSGPGLRLGVNAGYLKITRDRNWVPF